MENNLLEISENTYVGKVKDILELLASWVSTTMTETYQMNCDSVFLDVTHLNDACNLLDKMLTLIHHCKNHNYGSDKIIAIDLGYDDEGIHWIRTLKEENEY